MLRLSLVVTTICLAFSLSTSALAAKPPSNQQLYEMVKALQSRVAVLEKQNGKYQREFMEVRKGAEPAGLQLASLTQSVDEPKPMRLANPSGGALRPADNWSGMYWGASFGAGQTVASYSSDYVIGSAPPSPRSAVAGEDTNNGAVVDLFLGLNSRVRSRLIAGLQVEGSLTALNFNSIGQISPGTGNEFTAEVEAQWMASALARVGWLIRPDTMLYGLAGWTFAHFDTDNQFLGVTGFDADGLSVGAGIEKKIGPDWSIRAEYRFTDFGETDERFFNDRNDPIDVTRGVDRFDNKMHIGRIGISRRLGRSEPSAEALK